MDVKCSMCGKMDSITKIHKDYQKLAKEPNAFYVCELCKFRLKNQATNTQKEHKPL